MIRNVRCAQVRLGDVIGRDLFSKGGALLVERGTAVTPELVVQFGRWDLTFVPIEVPDEASAAAGPGPAIGVLDPAARAEVTARIDRGRDLKARTLKQTAQILDQLRLRQPVTRAATKQMVTRLVDETLANREILAALFAIRRYDNYLFNHSLNVCVLAVVVGKALKVSDHNLHLLGEAGLLHDAGMTLVPETVWNRPGPLTDEDRRQIERHPANSVELIERMGTVESDLAKAIGQHHEREDGSGYPQGLRSIAIHPLAQVLAVVDIYDAMTNPRPYRSSHPPYRTMRELLIQTNRSLNQEVVQAFVAEMSLYPVGSVVRLNTGLLGVVIRSQRTAPLRPMLKLVRDERGRALAEETFLDLAAERSVYIEEAVHDPQLVIELIGDAGLTAAGS